MFLRHFAYKQKVYKMNVFLLYPLHFQKVVYTRNGHIVAKSRPERKQNRGANDPFRVLCLRSINLWPPTDLASVEANAGREMQCPLLITFFTPGTRPGGSTTGCNSSPLRLFLLLLSGSQGEPEHQP